MGRIPANEGDARGGLAGSRGERLPDRRVRRSRRALVDAFDRLIVAMPLDRITVSALAREADVDRKTFYQHFGSVEGLLDAIAEEVVCELLDGVEQVMGEREPSGGAKAGDALSAFFDVLARSLGRDLVLEQRYYEHIPSELLLEHLARPLQRQVVERGLVSASLSETDLEMVVSFWLGGLLSLYRWWFLSDRAVPIDEVTRCAGRLAERGAQAFSA